MKLLVAAAAFVGFALVGAVAVWVLLGMAASEALVTAVTRKHPKH